MVWWANVCLLAASEPVNHYGPRKRLRTTFALSSISSHTLRPPRSVFPLPFSNPPLALPLSLSLPSSLSLTRSRSRSLCLSSFLPVLSTSRFLSLARSSPSFPSVPSSPRCSVLQARYNAARRRPSCIFKRAVLLCSRYRPHHLDRPLDDRSPPSPTSVSLPAILPVSSFLLSSFLPPYTCFSLSLPFCLSHFLAQLLFPCTKRVLSLPPSTFLSLSFFFAVCAHYSYCFHACKPFALFSVHYDAIKNFSGGYVPCL